MARIKWRNIVVLLALGGTSIAAVTRLPMLYTIHPEPLTLPLSRAVLSGPRDGIPPELAWFFVRFPYLTDKAQVQMQTRHMFRITHEPRRKLYIVAQGQKFRRVEIYEGGQPDLARIWIFTPGQWRDVLLQDGVKVRDQVKQEGNMWM